MSAILFHLRPSVSNMNIWYPDRAKSPQWAKIRLAVLERDNYTCTTCGHRAMKWMHAHHLEDGENNSLENLVTLCPACHAVMHLGLNMQYGALEVWKSELSQVEIVRVTRQGIREGKSLQEINGTLPLKRGRRAPDSVEWANALLKSMEAEPRAELPEPLCAVFVNFTKWQIEA